MNTVISITLWWIDVLKWPIIICGLLGIVLVLGMLFPKADDVFVPYEVAVEERFRELEQRVDTMEGQVELAKRLALAGSSENALAAAYADMASTYYGTMWAIDGSGITREAAASRIGEAVASDDQLAELWASVVVDQAPVRQFELLLLTKVWVSMTRGLAPALDG